MTPKPTDIILRKPTDSEALTVWLKEDYLLQLLPDLTSTYLRVRARVMYKASVMPCHRERSFLPATGKAWRYARLNNSFYYEYDSIPDKEPQRYASQLPTRAELIAMKKASDVQAEKAPLEAFIEPYLSEYWKEYLPAYGNCTPVQQQNLAKAAICVKAAIEYIVEKAIPTNKSPFFQQYANLLDKHDVKYLPHNYRGLKKLVLQAIEEDKDITDLVKLPRAGNQNAVVHADDEEIRAWIIQLRWDGKNFTNAHIIRKVQWMCLVAQKPVPSDRWIGLVMEEANTKWLTAGNRFGETGKYGQLYRGYIPMTNALFAGDCWQVDGTRVNILDFKTTVTDEDGNTRQKNAFLYIVAVRDVHSGDVLGYSFDISENRWVVHNALKMAVEETGYLPYQLVMDRFPGHNTPEMKAFFTDLENRGVKLSFAHKSTGKAKLERWFSTMQQVFMQESSYYYGEGVQSRNKFAHRSKEQLKLMKKAAKEEGWNFDMAVNEACRMIEAYRSTALSQYSRKWKSIEKSPAQLHQESEKPHTIALEEHQIIYLFGLRTSRKFTGEGLLTIDIQNYPFSYRCQDTTVVSQYDAVTVCYDLEDLSTIHLYEISDRPLKKYLGTAREVSVQMYGPNAEWAKKHEQDAIIASMKAERERQLSMRLAAGDETTLLMGGEVPKPVYEEAESQFLSSNNGDDIDLSNFLFDQL